MSIPATPAEPEVCPDHAEERALFPGDLGVMDPHTRVGLVRLLHGPFLDGTADPQAWAALRRDDGEVRRYLAEIFLTLVVDDEERIAFTQQAPEGSVRFPRLLRHLPLSLVDSALLLYLRQELSAARGKGQRAVVGLDEIGAQLLPYTTDRTTDYATQLKRIEAAVRRMKDNGILRTTPTPDRWEVSPVLRILFPPDQIAALVVAYDRLASGTGAPGERDPLGAPAGLADDPADGEDEGV